MNDIILKEHNLYLTGYKFKVQKGIKFLLKDGSPCNVLDLSAVKDFDIIEIGENLFSYTANLEKVILPKSLIGINNNAFYQCRNLSEVVFNDNLCHIKNGAFWGCQLKTFKAPKKLIDIGTSAFQHNSLKEVFLNDDLYILQNNAFAENRLDTIYVPTGIDRLGPTFAADQSGVSLVKLFLPEKFKSYFDELRSKGYEVHENSIDEILDYTKSFKKANALVKSLTTQR